METVKKDNADSFAESITFFQDKVTTYVYLMASVVSYSSYAD